MTTRTRGSIVQTGRLLALAGIFAASVGAASALPSDQQDRGVAHRLVILEALVGRLRSSLAEVERMRAAVSELSATVNAQNARIQALSNLVEAQTAELGSLRASVATQGGAIASAETRLGQHETRMASLEAADAAQQSRISSLQALIDQLATNGASLEQRVSALEQSAGSDQVIMWSGGSRFHGMGPGWNAYRLDGTDFNTAAGYLSVDPSGIVTVMRDGFYRINFWAISNSSGYSHIKILRNGSTIHFGHEMSGNAWSDNFADVTWHLQAGDTIQVYVNNGGGNGFAYHSWNQLGQHSRFQMQHLGS